MVAGVWSQAWNQMGEVQRSCSKEGACCVQGPPRPCGKPWAMCGNARLNTGEDRQCLQIFVFRRAIIISNYIHLLMVLLCLPFRHSCLLPVSAFTC